MTVNVFVYGTLMPGECNHPRYCQSYLKSATIGYVFGKIYHLKQLGYPGVCDGTDQVWGYFLTFDADFTLTALDDLEEYDPTRAPEQNEYNRHRTTVFYPNGAPHSRSVRARQTEAWIYRMTVTNIQRHQGIYLPSGRWSSRGEISQTV